MTAQPRVTITSRYYEYRSLYGTVPALDSSGFVCPVCLGVKGGEFATCAGCRNAGLEAHLGAGRTASFIPLSTAFQGGGNEPAATWYRALQEYKDTKAGFDEHHQKVTAVVAMGLRSQQQRIEQLLGGGIDRVTVVPSSRSHLLAPQALPTQPLYRALHRSRWLQALLVPTLAHSGRKFRSTVSPDAFSCVDDVAVRGKRFVLVDDSWVSGANAVSAYRRLLSCGAAAAVVVTAARVVRPSFAEEIGAEAYLDAAREQHDPRAWPRR